MDPDLPPPPMVDSDTSEDDTDDDIEGLETLPAVPLVPSAPATGGNSKRALSMPGDDSESDCSQPEETTEPQRKALPVTQVIEKNAENQSDADEESDPDFLPPPTEAPNVDSSSHTENVNVPSSTQAHTAAVGAHSVPLPQSDGEDDNDNDNDQVRDDGGDGSDGDDEEAPPLPSRDKAAVPRADYNEEGNENDAAHPVLDVKEDPQPVADAGKDKENRVAGNSSDEDDDEETQADGLIGEDVEKLQLADFLGHCDRTGWMRKKGGVNGNKKWQKRFFALSGRLILYYQKKEDYNPWNHMPKGSISLEHAALVEESATKRPLCFQIVCLAKTKPLKICTLCQRDEVTEYYEDDGSSPSKTCLRCSKKCGVVSHRKVRCGGCGSTVCSDCCAEELVVLACVRTFYLEPENETERESWITAVRSNLSSMERPKVLKSGFLAALEGDQGRISPTSKQADKKSMFGALGGKLQQARSRARIKFSETKGHIAKTDDKGWRPLFFVLRQIMLPEDEGEATGPTELAVFARIKDHLPPEKPLRVIALSKATLIPTSSIPGKLTAFQVITDAGETVTHLDLPPDGTETDFTEEWITAIAAAMPTKVFDVPIILSAKRSDPEGLVPSPIALACAWLNEHGAGTEGLYRIPGSKSEVDRVIALFDRGEPVVIPNDYNPANLASLVVQYLKRCPESIMGDNGALFQRVATEEEAGSAKLLRMMTKLVSLLTAPHRETLRVLLGHWKEVTKHAEENHMTSGKLSMCVYSQNARAIQVMLDNYETLFPPETDI